MKKFFLLAGLLLCGLVQAQDPIISVEGNNGQEITDGYVYNSTILGETGEARLGLLVTNLTESTIYVKLRLDSMENASGNNTDTGPVQFCFQTLCYFEVDENDVVPAQISQAAIAGGSHNNINDHFSNSYAGDTPGLPVVYHMSLVQFNANGTEIGPLLSFTYRYNPNMATSDLTALKNIGVTVESTVVKSNLIVNATESGKLDIYSVNGLHLKSTVINEGIGSIDVSGLSSAVYIVNFTNKSNQTSSIRIIKN